MTANTSPIFTLTPNITWGPIVASANTSTDGTGTTNTAFTGGANGSFLQRIKCQATGTNIGTVLRVFLNNGSTSATALNNALIADITLPASTASNSASIGPPIEVPLNIVIPSGYKALYCLGTAVASGWKVAGVGGDY